MEKQAGLQWCWLAECTGARSALMSRAVSVEGSSLFTSDGAKVQQKQNSF